MSQNAFKLFAERSFFDVCQERRQRIYTEIKAANADYLLNANEDDLVEHYLAKLRFDPIIMYPDQKTISGREAYIPAEWFPGDFNVSRGQSYPKYVVTFHVPYTGDTELLKLPNTRKLSPSGRSVWIITGSKKPKNEWNNGAIFSPILNLRMR